MRAIVQYNDPSPSRLRYRFERLWLKRSVRQVVRVWVPSVLICFAVLATVNNESVRNSVQAKYSEVYETFAARPELQITQVTFANVSEDLQQQILTVTGLTLPASSLDLDVVELKNAVETLDAVESAQIRILGGGSLEILTVERTPEIVWRDGETLRLMDAEGHRVADIARRSARGDLPLIVGLGAENEIGEVLTLVDISGQISDRVRGFVRVGERRWDLVLDRGQTIMLPERGAVGALRRVMALHQAEDLLNRDVVAVDMRNGDRPVLRLTDEAVAELRRLRTIVRGEDA